tara:strand:+ start:932 stop:1237 length:306 start_codon:yes stop_codon:yes gene_type:complete
MSCNRLNASLTSSLVGSTVSASLAAEFENVTNPKFQEIFLNQTVYPRENIAQVSGSLFALSYNKKTGLFYTNVVFDRKELQANLTGSTDLSLCSFGYQGQP